LSQQQALRHNSYDNDLSPSHQFANEIRELYDLPSMDAKKILSNIITNLNGFLNEHIDSDEDLVDTIKDGIENVF
jgi:hypothetical protein